VKTFVLNGWSASEQAWDLCAFPRDRVFSYVDQLEGLPEKAVGAEDGVILVGWSMGGSSALRLAVSYPEKIKGLVLVAATARMMKDDGWAGMSERRLAALELGLKMTHGEGFFGIPDGKPNPYILDEERNLARGLGYLRETDLRAALEALKESGRLKCPVAIFQSERDGIVRAENAAYLKSIFPQASMTMVPGSEHALPILIPEKIDAAVSAVLRENIKSAV
jgi:pimeloyl-ACP methyl ester carboxylesterase